MKKHTTKLAVRREVIRSLDRDLLIEVAGGAIILTNGNCVPKTSFCGGGNETQGCTVGE